MFEGWSNFYFMLGSASASLVGLMFVVTTLTRGGDRTQVELGQRLFMTPTVFNFAAVLTLSGLALVPRLDGRTQLTVMALLGAYGFGYAVVINSQAIRALIRQGPTPHWSDLWCYGVIPLGIYAGLEAMILTRMAGVEWGTFGMALSLLALLLIAIRNAWDLVTWLAPRREQG